MQILLTNDDGIFAPGLAALYKELVEIGSVTVVAPAASRSGTGHSITLKRPFACNKIDINGRADSQVLASRALLPTALSSPVCSSAKTPSTLSSQV
jgi:5'/3'-nucleotidase SurE